MTRGTLVVLLFVTFAAGAVGYVVGAGGAGPADPEDLARPAAPSVNRSARAPAVRESAPLSEEEKKDFRRILDNVDVEEFTTGRETITGRVMTPDGRALEGLLVRGDRQKRSSAYGYRRGVGPPEKLDPEALLRNHASWLRYSDANRRETLSGENGSFTLTDIAPDAEYRISAWKTGYDIRSRPYGKLYRPGDKVDLHARPLALITVAVRLPDGGEAENAKIEIRRGSGVMKLGWSSKDPVVAVDPGTHRIRAVGGPEGEFASADQEVIVDLSSSPPALTFQLEVRPGIRGDVTFPEGQEYSYGEAVVLRIPPGKEIDPDRLIRDGQRQNIYSYQSTKFVFLDLATGRYLIGLVMNRSEVVVSHEVEVAAGMVEQNLVAPPPDPEESIVIRAEGPDGKSLTSLYFTVGYTGPKGSHSGVGRFTRLGDGSYRVRHHPLLKEHEDPAIKDWISVRSMQYGTKKEEYSREGRPELTLRFEIPASLEVTLAGYLDTDYEGSVRLSLSASGGGGGGNYGYYGSGQNPLSAKGKQLFGPVQPGDYEILVALSEGQYQRRTVAKFPVTLKTGMNRETVTLPTLYTLTVLVDAKDGTRVYCQSKTPGFYSQQNGKVLDGQVVFERLSAGDYYVAGNRKRVNVKIPSQTQVRLE